MSGVNYDDTEICKGATEAIQQYVTHAGEVYSEECDRVVKTFPTRAGLRWWSLKIIKYSA